ncbi:MAG: glycosyltransferase [Candidatus Hermodarchaeota archaeon]
MRIILSTFSNFGSGAYGDAINDRKLFEAIPQNYNKIALFPKYKKNNKVSIKSIIKFYSYYLKWIISGNNIFIIRGPKLAILPILFKRIFKNRIILRSGCTPLMFVERKAFLRNLEYKSMESIFQKIFYYIEPILEKYALRNSDDFIVENIRAQNIIIYYGANPTKIKIIPYYIQEYFLKGSNPKFDASKDIFEVGYIGRFKKYDLIVPIIEAIKILKENDYSVRLSLIGDGPQRKIVQELVKKKSLQNEVKFLGSKSHIEVSDLINIYHCLIYPMLNNLCPSTIAIKILEGVMKGKIIITTESGNNSSLFLNNKKLIMKNTSSEDIAQKIKLVIENYELYRKIAENLSKYHLNLRSKSIYREKLNKLLSLSFR